MARQGRAGPALGISAFGSFIGGTLSVLGVMMLAPPLAKFAIEFGPPEYFSLIFCGLSILIYLAKGSVLKAVATALIGLFLGTIGSDFITGQLRFTFGNLTLMDGIGLVPVVMGLFGIAEVLENLEQTLQRDVFATSYSGLFPNRKDWKVSMGPISRGSILGFFLGILPGGGAVISSFASYAVEKRVSKHPELFGKGAIEGVAAPETANNAATGGAFIPLLTLGIPCNAVMALVLGALLIHGIQPGPLLMRQNPDLFWGVVASMYIGNAMLLVLNLPLIGLWVKILMVPYRILMPLILLFCLIGSYSINNNIVDVITMSIFGIAGYILRRFDYEAAPLLLAFILGPLLETSFRQSLIMSDGKFSIFIVRPISAAALLIGVLLFVTTAFSYYRKAKTKAILE